MPKRMPTPADYNDTSEEFPRKLHGCRREDFTATPTSPWYGLLLVQLLGLCLSLLLGLGLSALTSCGADAATTPSPGPATPLKTIPQGVCPPGHVGAWVDGATVQCFKELL